MCLEVDQVLGRQEDRPHDHRHARAYFESRKLHDEPLRRDAHRLRDDVPEPIRISAIIQREQRSRRRHRRERTQLRPRELDPSHSDPLDAAEVLQSVQSETDNIDLRVVYRAGNSVCCDSSWPK